MNGIRFGYLLAALLSILLVGQGAAASIVYSTIPADNSFDATYAYGVGGPSSSWGDIDVASSFTVPSLAYLYVDSIDVALQPYSGTAAIDVMVTANSGSNPGTILATAQVTAPGSTAVVTADFPNNLLLTVGQTYWVRLSPTGNVRALWKYSAGQIIGTCSYSSDNGQTWHGYSVKPAFRVNSIPEPAVLGLLALSAAVMLLRRP